MKQKKLRLDELEVESFHVLPEAPQERGTVQGQIVLTALAGCSDTCIYKATCQISCATCAGQFTCNNDSCDVTLCDTCARFTCAASCQGTCVTACDCSGDIFCIES
ncbi:MAG TPA: hypothetical protein VF771_04215 [Longimicrobiaceae bacterium]